jgi:hypothetical protein
MTTEADTTPTSGGATLFRRLTFKGLGLMLLLVTAAALRFTGLESRSYFNDELSALNRLKGHENVVDVIQKGVLPDAHPAGVQVFLWYWTKISGENPFLVRLPFALAGVASVWLLFLLGAKWFGRSAAWMAAAALTLLQFPLLYGQLIRPYSTGMLWIIAAAFCWDKIVFSKPGTPSKKLLLPAAGMALAFTMALYNHYFSFLMAGLIGITGLFLIRKETAAIYLAAGTLPLLLLLPHLQITIVQVSRGGLSAWLPPPDLQWMTQHILYLFNGSLWLALLITIPALALLIRRANMKTDRPFKIRLIIAWLWYLIPLTFAYLYSLWVNPILQHSIMLFSFPFLMLAVFAGFCDSRRRDVLILSVVLPLIMLAHLLFVNKYYHNTPYTNFRLVAEQICHHHDQEMVWMADVNHPWYIHHYLEPLCAPDSAMMYLFPGHEALPALDRRLDATTQNTILYTRLRPADPIVISLIRRHFPYLTACYDEYPYSETYLFSRTPEPSYRGQYHRDTVLLTEVIFHDATDTLRHHEEYLPVYEQPLPGNIRNKRNLLIHCEVDLITGDTLPDDLTLVVHSILPGGTPGPWHGIRLRLTATSSGTAFYTVELPHNTRMEWPLKVYLWNPGLEGYRIAAARVSWLRETAQQ